MARTTGQELETLLQRFSPEELQEIPKGNLVPGMLTQIWSLLAGQAEQRNAAELALELSPDYTGPRRLAGASNSPEAKRKEEERQRLESIRFYEDTMRAVQERSELLTQRIDERLRVDRKKLQEIEDHALRLHDGRAVYVGERGTYLDGQGRQLQGVDKMEAEDLHRKNPNASTWTQKEHMQGQLDELQQLKAKTQRLHDETKGGDGESLSDKQRAAKAKDADGRLKQYENEFSRVGEERTTALSSTKSEITDDTYGGSDYMAAYDRSTSYASTLDNAQNKSLGASFTPAATGQGAGTSPARDTTRPAPNTGAPANHMPSRQNPA